MKKLRTVFMGTPEIAVPSLEKVIELTNCVAIYTGTDKIQGRGQKMLSTPIKEIALKHSIPIEQPNTFKDISVIEKLKSYNPYLIIVMAYGFILPEIVLNIPSLAPINLHGSILPKYRGASPIHQALLNGDTKTGVTAQYMVKKMDAGDILHIEETIIAEDDNYITLSEKISQTASICVGEVIRRFEKDQITRTPQNEQEATYCTKIKHEDGFIDWSKSAKKICGEIKAYYLWPYSHTQYGNDKIIIKKAKVHSNDNIVNIGEIIQADKNGLLIQTGEGILSILELQLDKRKILDYKSFLNGYKLEKGKKL